MSFSGQVQAFTLHVGELSEAVHTTSTDLLSVSIKDGSPITGSPGQPVHMGDLYRSWKTTRIDKDTSMVSTDSPYAIPVEENLRGMVFRNHGAHSLKLSIVGWLKIVEQAVRQVAK